MEHRLAAILHADVKGYSRLIGEDEVATLRVLTPYLDMMNALVRQHGGHAVGSRGDSLLAEFPSVVEAVQCAVEMQHELKVRNAELPTDRRVEYCLHGIEYLGRYTKETNTQARQMFEKAIELDPKYAGAYALLDATYLAEWSDRWSQDPQTLERAFELAQRAAALDDSLFLAHKALGWVYLLNRQHEQAIAEIEKAIALAPNNALLYRELAPLRKAGLK